MVLLRAIDDGLDDEWMPCIEWVIEQLVSQETPGLLKKKASHFSICQ